MGIHISKTAALAPITTASTIIGFISFAFTVFTFLRVFWGNIQTIMHARQEIPDALGNVKQELYEERNHLRVFRKRRKTDKPSEVTARVLYEAVCNMLHDFKNIERRFLVDSHQYWEPYYDYNDDKGRGSSGSGRSRGRWVWDRGWTDDDDYLNVQYRNVDLWERVIWLRNRGAVLSIAQRLTRIQTRRIARQTNNIGGDTRFLCEMIQDVEDRLYRVETRLSNIVGVRRAD